MQCALLAVMALMVSPALASADCIDAAALYRHVSPSLVRAIAMHESGMRPLAWHRNLDGSIDIGLMQINSRWLPILSRSGIEAQSLWDPCINVWVGSWILEKNIVRFGPTWKAVGAYNAASPDKQLRYATQIYAQWQSIARNQARQRQEAR
jgi:soluble lytic murein transglycosylase-like protein